MSGTVARRRIPLLSLLTALVAVLVVPTTATAAPRFQRYVALGDSYAAGPLIPAQRTDPIGCFRSTRNYPSLVAAGLGVAGVTDVSCSGATTADMSNPQPVLLGPNPPQLDALRSDTDLVTVTIGGNDIGFTEILLTCGRASALDPFGAPCKKRYTAGGVDQLDQRIAATAPKIAAVLEEIHRLSPKANVVVVGYLRILPPSQGCWPVVPISVGDVPYLDSVEQKLNAMIGEQAGANRASFVDPYRISSGHDVCQTPGAKWVEGMMPTAPAYPVHPNASGMSAVAGLVLGSLRAPAA
jgi:lysophospholipase L1-like esterase